MARKEHLCTANRSSWAKDGVTILRDQAYGEDPRQILDVYRPTARSGAPVVIFVHSGAYVRGDKDGNGEAYGNISI
jgi:acetyl esterase